MIDLARCVLASHNEGKLSEMRALFTGWPVEIVSQASLGICSPPETALTFVENALLKARHASRSSGLPAIADDSGIEVDALGGAPGIYSAHYAGEGATDAANVELLLEHVGEVPDEERTARFRGRLSAVGNGSNAPNLYGHLGRALA